MNPGLAVYRALTRVSEPLGPFALRLRASEEEAGLHAERMGRRFPGPVGGAWWHAASLGEVAALEPVLDEVAGSGANVITTTTVPGRNRAQERWPGCASLAPLDFPGAVARTLAAREPRALITVETEIWPNLWREAARRGVSMAMVNARISDRAWPRYRRLKGIFRPLLEPLAAVAAREPVDAERLLALGASVEAVTVAGNTKHDRLRPERVTALRFFPADRPTWVAASVHPGEGAALLECWRRLRRHLPDVSLVLAPRHRGREDEWVSLFSEYRVARRSRPEELEEPSDIVLLDTHGELAPVLAGAAAAFVGGTLVPVGGHNALEASVLGIPVVIGPQTQNIREDAARLIAGGAAVPITDGRSMSEVLEVWLGDETARTRAAGAATETAAALRGGSRRSVDWLVRHGVIPGADSLACTEPNDDA